MVGRVREGREEGEGEGEGGMEGGGREREEGGKGVRGKGGKLLRSTIAEPAPPDDLAHAHLCKTRIFQYTEEFPTSCRHFSEAVFQRSVFAAVYFAAEVLV